ncbi:MAG TPA: hypothetical protein DIC52_21190 [Candidatus Latescibacteria bacterium]|nr:hypothetical protein [Candidatus Latescibacterota bacterium]
MAGAIAELKSSTLGGEFRAFDSYEAEVILLEGADRVLPRRTGRQARGDRHAYGALGSRDEDHAPCGSTGAGDGGRTGPPGPFLRRCSSEFRSAPGDLCHRRHGAPRAG